jgi:Natural resistance-associated macrophage protein-like
VRPGRDRWFGFALQLLFGLPLILGVCATALDVCLILWLQNRGFRYIEALVMALLCVIGGCFAFELVLSQPDVREIAAALLPSRQIVTDPAMLYLAIGIIGATVMPHNLYLHSAIVQTRKFDRTERGKREAIRFATIDWALLPATARPRVKAASRLKPNRSATTVAQRVRTGARFTRIVRLCSEVFMLRQPRAPQEVAGIQLWPLDYRGNAGENRN